MRTSPRQAEVLVTAVIIEGSEYRLAMPIEHVLRYPTSIVCQASLSRVLTWLEENDALLPADPDLSAAIDELKANLAEDHSNLER